MNLDFGSKRWKAPTNKSQFQVECIRKHLALFIFIEDVNRKANNPKIFMHGSFKLPLSVPQLLLLMNMKEYGNPTH